MPNTTKHPVNETAEETSGKLVDRLVDQPTTDDLLGFEDFAISVAKNINNKNKNTKITMGIYGEWGSGKTSFLQMIEKHLAIDIKPIWFKAWEYDEEDHLWVALLKTILDQTKQRADWYPKVRVGLSHLLANSRLRAAVIKVGSILLRFALFLIGIVILLGLNSGQIVDFLKTNNSVLPTSFQSFIVKILGFAAAFPFLSSLFGFVKESLNVKVTKTEDTPGYRCPAFLDEFKTFRENINQLKPGKPLVVIIDDLDRCSPEKTIQVLEVIVAFQAFQDSKDFVFLLALDRKMIEVSIAAKYKEMMTLNNDQNGLLRKRILFYECYMEKIFQQSIFLPLLSKFKIENFVTNLSCDGDIKQCASIFAAGIPPNPRKIKCILRAFLFIRDVVKGDEEIKPSLLAKLIVIKYQFPDVFEAIAERPSLLEELEKNFRNNQAGDGPLSKQVEQYVADYPELGRMLIEGDDTFIEAKLCRYIALTCAAG